MVNIQEITQCLWGRLGFRFRRDTDLGTIDADLFESRSGMYWEEGHPLVTLERLQAVAEQLNPALYPLFDETIYYKPGEIVKDDNNAIYRKLDTSLEGTPLDNTGAWAPTTPLSVWLRGVVEGTIKNVVQGIFQRKTSQQVVKSILEDAYLYDGAGNVNDKEIKEGRFVGYQFVFRGTDGLRAQITKIGSQFSAAQTIPIYLYYTGQAQAIMSFDLDHTKDNSIVWSKVSDVILRYSTDNGVGGAWFLGYYEDDLPMGVQAINRSNFNFYTGPCSGCGNNLYALWAKWFKYLSVIPFAVPAGELPDDRSLVWDWTKNQYYHESKTWGLNFQISITCDVSTVVCRQQQVFDEVLKLQFANDMLHEIAYSDRINRTQEKSQQKAMFELDDREKSSQKGLKTKLATAIAAVDFDFSDLGSVCSPCAQATGVTASSF